MKYLLSLILVIFSFNTYAFVCTDKTTINYPSYDKRFMGKDVKPKIYPTSIPLTDDDPTTAGVITYCLRGVFNRQDLGKQMTVVMQEGTVTDDKGKVRYAVNFTEGYAALALNKPTSGIWWETNIPDWIIVCNRDDFEDLDYCGIMSGTLSYQLTSKGSSVMRIGDRLEPMSDVCIRIDNDKPICTREDKPFAGDKAYALIKQITKADKVRVRYTDISGRKHTETIENNGASTAYSMLHLMLVQMTFYTVTQK